MRIYMDNKTGNLCLLTLVNTKTRKFIMEYEWGWMKATAAKEICVMELINRDYTEIGYLS